MQSIIATDINSGISKNGIIPWHSKTDMKFFVKQTTGNVVIMGSTTYFSIPENKRPLKNRWNVVLTRTPQKYTHIHSANLLFTDDENVYNHLEDFFEDLPSNYKIFVIGGKQIYEKFLPLCSTIWHTTIKRNYDCDLFVQLNSASIGTIVYEDDELQIIKK